MAKIRNLGPVSMRWLASIGIETMEELRAIGSLDAYRLMALRSVPVSLNLLWAMEAAIRDMDWRELPIHLRAELRERLRQPWDPTPFLEL